MTMQPHLEWPHEDIQSTIRYRFFYAQEDDIGVEVVLNQDYRLQVGMLNVKSSEYTYERRRPLLHHFPLSTTRPDSPVINYTDAEIESSLITTTQYATQSSPLAEKVIKENMGTILENIKDFLEPYRLMHKIFSSTPENFLEIFPEHQLYALLHGTSKIRGVSSEKAYLVKSEKGLPYIIVEWQPYFTFQTAFGQNRSISVPLIRDSHVVSCVAFPHILKPEKICKFQRNREKTIRVSFAKINDFNPCIIREEILNDEKERQFSIVNLTIAPFPAVAYHRYLKGKIQLPEGTKTWLLQGGKSQ